jgi:hypothetical protein
MDKKFHDFIEMKIKKDIYLINKNLLIHLLFFFFG